VEVGERHRKLEDLLQVVAEDLLQTKEDRQEGVECLQMKADLHLVVVEDLHLNEEGHHQGEEEGLHPVSGHLHQEAEGVLHLPKNKFYHYFKPLPLHGFWQGRC
jgi:hypothetical protein